MNRWVARLETVTAAGALEARAQEAVEEESVAVGAGC